jgi:heme O synthase-like polyprenyltransferase
MSFSSLSAVSRRARFADFVELTKPRITLLVLVTTVVGFYMGSTPAIFRRASSKPVACCD